MFFSSHSTIPIQILAAPPAARLPGDRSGTSCAAALTAGGSDPLDLPPPLAERRCQSSCRGWNSSSPKLEDPGKIVFGLSMEIFHVIKKKEIRRWDMSHLRDCSCDFWWDNGKNWMGYDGISWKFKGTSAWDNVSTGIRIRWTSAPFKSRDGCGWFWKNYDELCHPVHSSSYCVYIYMYIYMCVYIYNTGRCHTFSKARFVGIKTTNQAAKNIAAYLLATSQDIVKALPRFRLENVAK